MTPSQKRWHCGLLTCGNHACASKAILFPSSTIDGHRNAVYADHLIPRALVERLGKVLGCCVLVVLHDQEGHPLLLMENSTILLQTGVFPKILTHSLQENIVYLAG